MTISIYFGFWVVNFGAKPALNFCKSYFFKLKIHRINNPKSKTKASVVKIQNPKSKTENQIDTTSNKNIAAMSKNTALTDIAISNEHSLKRLIRAIALSKGQFSLILVRWNYTVL